MFGSGLIDENWAIFFTFTTDHKFAACEVDGITVKIAEFRNAKSAREE